MRGSAARRRLLSWALCVAFLKHNLNRTELRYPSSGADAAVSASYNDTRPPAPGGYLCVHGEKGRLNNLILQSLVGLYMAHHLNRTFLVNPQVSKYYDVDRLSLATYGASPHAAAVAIGESEHATCGDPAQISPYHIEHTLTIRERFEQYDKQTRGRPLVSVHNSDAWYWLGRPPEQVYGKFFGGLVPRRAIREKVHAFLQERDWLPTNGIAYNAVHLRHFEGKCGSVETDLCCPHLSHVQEILMERGGIIDDPLFVANDRQCPPDVLLSYTNATDPVIMGYAGACEGAECAVLDFELCLQAAVFVGNAKSSGDMNIREWRLARYGRPGWTSVLWRRAEALALEERREYATRYIVGHWGFRPDCNDVSPRQRGTPCA